MEPANVIRLSRQIAAAAAIGAAALSTAHAAEPSRAAVLEMANDEEKLVPRNMPFFASARPADAARHVTLTDGTRIALFIHLPPGFDPASGKAPVVFEQTIYGHRNEIVTTAVELYRAAGFAVVVAEVRGTAASFGNLQWDHDTDRRDARELIALIASQPWSDGTVTPIGLSISGTYADMMAGLGLGAVKAAVIRNADYDHYADNLFPGGIPNRRILGLVGELVAWYGGGPCANDLAACPKIGFQTVDADTDFSLLQAAVREHRADLPGDAFLAIASRDDRLGTGTLDEYSSISDRAAIAAAKVPARISASWVDGTTADGALLRFADMPDTPMNVVISAATHPGGLDADPFSKTPFDDARPAAGVQFQADVDFIKAVLSGEPVGRSVTYAVLGTDAWKTSTVWPPAGIVRSSFRLAPGALTDGPIAATTVGYTVDPASSFGPLDRWGSQTGGRTFYGDLRSAPGRRLEFTGAPVGADTELVGAAELCLVMSSDQTSGLVIAYLEDIAPDGRVTYLTEGLINLVHRKTEGPACDPAAGTTRSFSRADLAPVVPGETMTVEIPFLQTAALIRKGHAIRLALAGADKETFGTLTGDAPAKWTVRLGGEGGSRLTLPFLPWKAGETATD